MGRGRNGTTESIGVEITPPAKDIFSQECYRIYGIVAGGDPHADWGDQ